MRTTIVILAVAAIFGAVASAHGEETSAAVSQVLEAEAVTTADLGVGEPGLLPSSPFYIFKSLGRGIRRAFTFNSVKKAELELRFADEKLAEARKLAEAEAERTAAVNRAIENYRSSAERLRSNLEGLRETSANPNVDRLLEKLADRAVKHEKLLGELREKFGEESELAGKLEEASKTVSATAVAAAAKEDPGRFAERIEKALVESRGSDFKHLHSIEVIDRLHDAAGDQLREKLSDIREDFAERFGQDLRAFAEAEGEDAGKIIRESIERLPGDRARRLVILEELMARSAPGVGAALTEATAVLEREAEDDAKLAERAEEALRHAEERVEKLESKLQETPNAPIAAEGHAREARAHLRQARAALEARRFGEAFGQARSAEVLARNGLRILEAERPDDEDLREDIAELGAKLGRWEERIAEFPPEYQEKAKAVLTSAREELRLAEVSLANGAFVEAKRHLEAAKEGLHWLERLAHAFQKPTRGRGERPVEPVKLPAIPGIQKPAGASETPRPVASRCDALKDNIGELKRLIDANRISQEDYDRKLAILERELAACRIPRAPLGAPDARIAPLPEPGVVCTKEFAPVCGVNGKTYPNSCEAKVAGVPIQYRGECGRPLDTSSGTPPALVPEPSTAEPAPPASVTAVPAAAEFTVEADDLGFYPPSIRVVKGSKVVIRFRAREANIYFGGLEFRSTKFKTPAVRPGGETSVEFIADGGFSVASYWPASGVRKADLKIEAE